MKNQKFMDLQDKFTFTHTSVPGLTRLTVSQHEHLTVVALRVYINNVWQPPHISRAISIAAQEIHHYFISTRQELFEVRDSRGGEQNRMNRVP